jgi:hypothetical protein
MDSASLRSVYRLFLRTVSASVLHHTSSVHGLRRLYRPIFRSGHTLMTQLNQPTLPESDRELLHKQLVAWNNRIDTTLKLLLSSAQSRGLPDALTRNMVQLERDYAKVQEIRMSRPAAHWDGQMTEDVLAQTHASIRGVMAKRAASRELEDRGWDVLHRTVQMAEGTAGVFLGQTKFDRYLRMCSMFVAFFRVK